MYHAMAIFLLSLMVLAVPSWDDAGRVLDAWWVFVELQRHRREALTHCLLLIERAVLRETAKSVLRRWSAAKDDCRAAVARAEGLRQSHLRGRLSRYLLLWASYVAAVNSSLEPRGDAFASPRTAKVRLPAVLRGLACAYSRTRTKGVGAAVSIVR